MGAPALVVGVLVKLTVREPRTSAAKQQTSAKTRDVCLLLWTQASTRHLCLGLILLFTMGFGLAPWYAAFMMRSHAMGTAELGMYLGLIFGLAGVAGVLLGGFVTGRWFGDDERGQLRVTALMVAALTPFFVAFLLLPQKLYALGALVPLIVAFNFFFGPTFALLQRLVPDDMRATAMALVMLLANLIGMGLGPQIVGLLSDRFTPMLGLDALRYSMLAMSAVALWSAFHFWTASREVRADLARISRHAD
jgi:predicted MFS family arabinose efflux permease